MGVGIIKLIAILLTVVAWCLIALMITTTVAVITLEVKAMVRKDCCGKCKRKTEENR